MWGKIIGYCYRYGTLWTSINVVHKTAEATAKLIEENIAAKIVKPKSEPNILSAKVKNSYVKIRLVSL